MLKCIHEKSIYSWQNRQTTCRGLHYISLLHYFCYLTDSTYIYVHMTYNKSVAEQHYGLVLLHCFVNTSSEVESAKTRDKLVLNTKGKY